MGRSLPRAIEGSVLALVLSLANVLGGCGGGGSGGGSYATVEFVNSPTSSHTITQVVFDYFDISLIGDRSETVTVEPGRSVSFGFTQFQAENLFDATLTWSDMTTTVITIFPFASGGGALTYPVTH